MTNEFIDIIGNISVSILSKDDIRTYIKTLIKLPINRRKIPRYGDLSIDEVKKLKDGKVVSYDIYKTLFDIFAGSHIYLFNNLLFIICLISLEISYSLHLKQ